MRIIVGDIEVFRFDWISVFYDISNDTWSVFHNNNDDLRTFMGQSDVIFCGFNNKHYDNHIWKAISCGADNALVKEINDFIIKQDRVGWEHWFLRKNRFWFDSFDLMDDTQDGTSLKHIEAHLGMNIEETEVDFDINSPLTPEEIERTIFYCKWDVRATAKLLALRKGYLDTKLNVGRSLGLPDTKSLYNTNARLTATALSAKAVERYDEREYQYPSNLRLDLVPPEVIEFFDGIHDESIPRDEYFKSCLEFKIGECAVKVGFGGIHAAIPNYIGGDGV